MAAISSRIPHQSGVMQMMEEVTEHDLSNPLQDRLGLQGTYKGQKHVQLVLDNNFIWM